MIKLVSKLHWYVAMKFVFIEKSTKNSTKFRMHCGLRVRVKSLLAI